jgi:hypothetical protein
MRVSRTVTALAAVATSALAAIAWSTSPASAAVGSADRGPACTVMQAQPFTPAWTIGCARHANVSAHVVMTYDILRNPPAQATMDATYTDDVAAHSQWRSSILSPGLWFIYQGCTTYTANGVRIGATCFARPDYTTTGISYCGVGEISTVPLSVQFGCPRGASAVTVRVSYIYTMPGHWGARFRSWSGTYQTARGQVQAVTPPLPAGAYLLNSRITVTDGAGNRIGWGRFNRG